MMRTIMVAGLLIIFISTGLSIYISSTLPPKTDEIIEEVINSGPVELIRGTTGFAKSGDINIWYELITPDDDDVKGTMLLIMGIANDALAWPDFFIQPLLDSGYQVIRFDSRGTGQSDWITDWDADHPYSLKDMADDAVAVLNHLEIDKAHVVGISMGGMVAQSVAIHFPQKTLSLTTIMSSGFIMDPELPGIPTSKMADLFQIYLKYGLLKSEANTIKLHIAVRKLLKGKELSQKSVSRIAQYVLYNIRNRHGYNSAAPRQHITAIYVSGSRYDQLRELDVPTLVVHGKADPFIPFAHGLKVAELIPNAEKLWVDDLGHDLSENISDTLFCRWFNNISVQQNHITN